MRKKRSGQSGPENERQTKSLGKLKHQDWINAFNAAKDTYVATHPSWHLEVLLSLIKWGLSNLRGSIERNIHSEVNGFPPILELHYKINWDWNSPRDETITHGSHKIGKLTKSNTKTFLDASQTLAQMMQTELYARALSHFTNEVWYEKCRNQFYPYVSIEQDGFLKRIKDPKRKREYFDELFRPFSIGVSRVAIPKSGFKTNQKISRCTVKELKTTRMDVDGISFNGKINGKNIWTGLLFEIGSLIVDYDLRRAYYPITVGLSFNTKLNGESLIVETPFNWPVDDQNSFWDALINGVDSIGEKLIPKSEQQGTVSIQTSDGLKMVRPLSTTKETNSAIQWLSSLPAQYNKEFDAVELHSELDAVNSAKNSQGRGKALERLIKSLFEVVPGFTVKSNIRTQTEEIDLEILNESEDPILRREEGIILVECKNWESKCGKDEIVLFKSKMENRKNRCSLGFLVSWNGFCETVKKEILRSSQSRLLIVPLNGAKIKEAIRDGSFFNLIKSSFIEAINI